MGTLSSRRFLVVDRRTEKCLTSRLIKPLTRPPAGGRNPSGARFNVKSSTILSLYRLMSPSMTSMADKLCSKYGMPRDQGQVLAYLQGDGDDGAMRHWSITLECRVRSY